MKDGLVQMATVCLIKGEFPIVSSTLEEPVWVSEEPKSLLPSNVRICL